MNATVLRSGFLTTVQDLGRIGFRHTGVSIGGALDQHALRIANLLVGNEEFSAGLEATFGSLRLHFDTERVVAWCGGEFDVRIGMTKLPPGHACVISTDEELLVVAPKVGSRAWLAISGGINVPLVLGSRSTDLRGKFGGLEGRVLRDGDVLPLCESSALSRRIAKTLRETRVGEWTVPSEWASTARRARFIRILRGADWSRFHPDAPTALLREPFTVTSDSDRMGVRFEGPGLKRADRSELLSEAVAPGAIQVPPGGSPILLLGDCQTIGGYPKIAHVITVDLPIAAQLQPGEIVRFQEVSLEDAHQLLLERENAVTRFRIGVEFQTP